MLGAFLSPGQLTLVLFLILVIVLLSGLPLSFTLGGVAVVFAVLFWNKAAIYMFPSNALGTMRNVILVAVALFIYMGAILQRTGIGEDLYDMAYRTMGRLRGGLAIGTVMICTVFAAMAGASAPATVSMGLVALPSMLKRKYSHEIAIGSIAAGGALGILIPPSVTMILYAMMTGTSVGALFIGGIFPGLLLATLFSTYIGIKCTINPNMGPSVSKETLVEEKLTTKSVFNIVRTVLLPIALILVVLGSIYTGIATPTEAAAVGAFGALVVAAINRRLNFHAWHQANMDALRLSVMVLWIAVGGLWFSSVYQAIGGSHFVSQLILGSELGPWSIIIIMQLTFFLLGMLMDPSGIIFITMPVYYPIILQLGFDPVWFGVLFIVNMEMAYITPPFGVNLFYLKAIVSKEIAMVQIYRACLPFIVLQAIGLVLVMIFPQIILWLPGQML